MFTTRLQENIGKILHNRYTLVAAIGQGASGDVYLAHDLSLGRKVAIKLLHSSLAGDPFFLKRFQSEAKSAASLNHPNIMRVFDWGESGSTPYLVLEYLSGGSLREFLNTGEQLNQEQAATLMLQVAQGLAYAHGRGYVHRDIKPANLLFDDEARIRIADFGLARALSEAAWTEPVGTLMGTARYASPEQAMAKESDRSSDVYSLGLVIHEALLGYLPFTGDTTVALLMARVQDDVLIPDSAGSLKPILESCLKLSAVERISSSELVSHLEKLIRILDPPNPLIVKGPAPMITDSNGDLTEAVELAIPLRLGAIDEPTGSTTSIAAMRNFPEPLDLTASDLVPMSENGGPTTNNADKGDGNSFVWRRSNTRERFRKKPVILGSILVVVIALIAALFYEGGPSRIYADLFNTKVPLVVGDSLASAKTSITGSHLKVGSISYAYSPSVKAGVVSSESPKSGTSIPHGKFVNIVVSKGHAPVELPSVVGLALSAAQNRLKAVGLVPEEVKSYSETVPVGQVMSSSPSSGLQPVGKKITLTVSEGPAPRKVPNLVGEKASDATSQIKALKLVPYETKSYSDSVASGVVISQSQTPGSMVDRGSTISFVVSKGPQYVKVPNVIGDTLTQAETAINAAGLTVGSVYSYFGSNTVLATSPREGSSVRAGSSVAIVTG